MTNEQGKLLVKVITLIVEDGCETIEQLAASIVADGALGEDAAEAALYNDGDNIELLLTAGFLEMLSRVESSNTDGEK